jgi:hypothetical protein
VIAAAAIAAAIATRIDAIADRDIAASCAAGIRATPLAAWSDGNISPDLSVV